MFVKLGLFMSLKPIDSWNFQHKVLRKGWDLIFVKISFCVFKIKIIIHSSINLVLLMDFKLNMYLVFSN